MGVQVTTIRPGFVAEIIGLDISRPVPPDDMAALWDASDEHAVLVFRGQTLTDAQQIAFTENFGQPERYVFSYSSKVKLRLGRPEIADVSNLDAATGQPQTGSQRHRMVNLGNRLWHTDSSFKRVPALASVLSSRIIPGRGGETEYVSTRLAFERLDPALQRRLENSFAWHEYAYSRGKIAPDLAGPAERAALPPQCWRLIWKNPINGRKALYMASHTCAIEGMRLKAARELLAELTEAATAPGASYLHSWRKGDVVMWDNRATMHRGWPWPAREPRYMVRSTISATAVDGLEAMHAPPRQTAE